MSKKPSKTTELIVSYGTEMIGTRFRIKVSKMDTGASPETILVVVQDLLDGGFKMKCFRNKDDVANFLKLLYAAI